MARLPGINTELAAAVRAINAAYNRLSPAAQGRVEIAYDAMEAEVDAAILAGDRTRALAAIRAWRGHWLSEFERAGS
ncbi:MAG TPA: hypothetical protein VFI03_12265 [Solirubrobacterales bacterium]|nr:hypothetical protein [Solirubrobacterales bacterium]